MSVPILVLQPDHTDPPGRLGEWLIGAGAELRVVQPFVEPVPADPSGYRAMVCLGGEIGATDDLDHPWLAGVRRLLAASVTAGVPTLGVCLGGQLLAVALGGRVSRGAVGPEIGPGLVAKRDAAWTDPLLADAPFTPDVMQWHRDVIDVLPPGARQLAASATYPNQAFVVGATGYGLQFHIETTTDMVLDWAEQSPDAAAFAAPGELDRDRLNQVHADIEETWQPVIARFVGLAAGTGPRNRHLPVV